jgi:hypothetical protein
MSFLIGSGPARQLERIKEDRRYEVTNWRLEASASSYDSPHRMPSTKARRSVRSTNISLGLRMRSSLRRSISKAIAEDLTIRNYWDRS